MAQVQLAKRPQRWDETLGRERIPADLVALILSSRIFRDIKPDDFPDDLPLEGVIANDCKLIQLARGDLVYREGSYQTSIFIVLNGGIRLEASSGTGRIPEQRVSENKNSRFRSLLRKKNAVVQPTPVLLERYDMFGELEAMSRTPRSSTAVAHVDGTVLLEITWPGARELLHWSDALRHRVESLYRTRSIDLALIESTLFSQSDMETLASIAKHCSFERHGNFDWTHRYQRESTSGRNSNRTMEQEPIIVEQGHYLEDLFLIRSGFARVTERIHDSERTVGFLERGDMFGFAEITEGLRTSDLPHARQGLRAIGYCDVVRIPENIIEKYMWLGSQPDTHVGAHTSVRSLHDDQSMREFIVDNRFINATQAMVIDTTRCVGCDDCVRACAATHDGIPRFERRGPTHANLMVATACMHCADPVCLIDCPTGAIHRDAGSGSIVIDDNTCIGCATCSSACPYDNIHMRKARNADGAFLIDEDGAYHLKASKCDLCAGQSSGPACQRACPHDALTRVDIREMNVLSDRQEHI